MAQHRPRVSTRQVLTAETLHKKAIGAMFWAVIIDPDTQKTIAEVPIYQAKDGEVVELALERQTLFPPRGEDK